MTDIDTSRRRGARCRGRARHAADRRRRRHLPSLSPGTVARHDRTPARRPPGSHRPPRRRPRAAARPGRRRPVGARSGATRPPLRRPGVEQQPGAAARPGVPRHGDGCGAGGGRTRPGRTGGRACAVRRLQPDRRGGTEQQPAAQPDGHQGVRRHRGRQHRTRRAGVPHRHGSQATRAADGRTRRLRGRPRCRHVARRGRPPTATVRIDPVPPANAEGALDAAADRAADDQQALRPRPGARTQPDRVPHRSGPAGVHHVVAQPRRQPPRQRHRCLRRRRRRRVGRGPSHHQQCARQRDGGVLWRHHRLDGDGPPRRHRRSPGASVHAVGHCARPGPGRDHRNVDRRRDCRTGDERLGQAGLPRRQLAGRGVRLAASQRPHLELLGQQLPARPHTPAFDILYWNADTTRMPARLHHDFLRMAMANSLVTADAATMLGTPVDLAKVDADSYVVAGVADHLCRWQSCYQSTQLLGGSSRFVLSTSGHVAALVNPPDNPKANFRAGDDPGPDAEQWAETAERHSGSWWSDHADWLAARSGRSKSAPTSLGGGGFEPREAAPGTYVFEK